MGVAVAGCGNRRVVLRRGFGLGHAPTVARRGARCKRPAAAATCGDFPLTTARVAVRNNPMATATLTIDLDAIAANWRALDRLSGPGRADRRGGQGRCLRPWRRPRGPRAGAGRARAGSSSPMAEEGAEVRQALGPGPQINVLSGHMPGDTEMISDLDLTPMLNSLEQITRHLEALPGHALRRATGYRHEPAGRRDAGMAGRRADPAGGRARDAAEPSGLRRRAGSPDEPGPACRRSTR